LAGNLSSYSSTVDATTNAAIGGSDFATRCAAAGVVKCVGFDSNTDLGVTGTSAYGANFGNLNTSGGTCPTGCPAIDTTVAASGAGSLKFIQAALSNSGGAGQWFTNFSADLQTQYGSGQDFYVGFRWRANCDFVWSNCPTNTLPRNYEADGGGGWKMGLVSAGDPANGSCTQGNTTTCKSSCTEMEVVPQNTFHRGIIQGYHRCPSEGATINFEEQFNGTDFKYQNAIAGFCPRTEIIDTVPPNFTHCFPFRADEWIYILIHITIGTWNGSDGYPNSRVEFWAARDGQAKVKIQDYTLTLFNYSASESIKYGKVWLTPYNSGRTGTVSSAVGTIWYDELIITTVEPADPAATTATSPPASPSGFKLK